MAFTRWDPISDLLAIQQRLDRFQPGPGGWVPPVDLHETPAEYVITAELPGFRREDVRIEMLDGQLTLAGARRERGLPCERYHRVERGHGNFTRTLHLPQPVDGEHITADLHDGVLTVTCPKISDGGVRRVQIT